MRKLFIFLALAIILLAGTFLFKPSSDVQETIPLKVLDSETEQVTLKNPRYANGDLDAIFDDEIEPEVLEFDLKSHSSVNEIKKVGLGNQVVMFYDVHSLYGLSQALGEPEFTDMRTGKLVQRDWRYVYFGNDTRDVYGNGQCNTLENGTEICEQIITGTETYLTWLPYNSRDIPKGQMRIGIETYVNEKDWNDVVWNVGGKRIDRHANFYGSTRYEYYLFQDNWNSCFNTAGNQCAQTFTIGTVGANENFSIAGVSLRLFKQDTPDISTVYITAVNAIGDPNMSAIYSSGTFNGNDLGTDTAGAFYNISLSPNILLNASTKYAIVLNSNGTTTTDDINWNKHTSGNYTGGQGYLGTISTNSFTGFAGDFAFEVWGNSTVVVTDLNIFLISPANNTNFTENNISLQSNVTPDSGITIANVSLYINGTINETNTSGISGTYNFSKTLSDGNYNWTIKAYGNDSIQYNATNGTLFFAINLTEINVTLNSPTNATITNDLSNIFNASATGNSYDLDNATLYIWFSNGTLFLNETNTSISGTGTSEFTINATLDGFANYLWNFYVCGNATLNNYCTFATNNFTLILSPFSENSVNYTGNVLETSGQIFTINVSANPSVSAVSGKLWYNGSDYTANISNPTSGIYISNNSIDIPLQESGYSVNKSFFWQFDVTLDDGTLTQQNTSTNNQIVNRTYFELCNATYPTPLINFTTKSAENPFPEVNATFKSAWSWFVSTGEGSVTRNTSYEDVNENKTTFDFCTSNYTTSFITTSIINYDANLYSPNFYYLKNATLSNTTQDIELFLLNDSKATVTVIKVREEAQQPIEDALIQIQLFDVGTNTYFTVAMAETNFDGEDVVYLNWYDTLYKFIIIIDGETVKSTQPYKIAETPQIFDIIGDITFSFEKFRDFQYSLVYNNLTGNFVLTYTKPSGAVDEACLRVTRRTAQNDTQICLTCEASSSATLFCNINNQGNGTYIASFYATGSLDLVDWITTTIGGSFAEEIFEELGLEDATAYAILFGGLVFALFLVTPVLGIIGIILGIFGASALGFATIDYMTYFGILILGGIMIWILKR